MNMCIDIAHSTWYCQNINTHVVIVYPTPNPDQDIPVLPTPILFVLDQKWLFAYIAVTLLHHQIFIFHTSENFTSHNATGPGSQTTTITSFLGLIIACGTAFLLLVFLACTGVILLLVCCVRKRKNAQSIRKSFVNMHG